MKKFLIISLGIFLYGCTKSLNYTSDTISDQLEKTINVTTPGTLHSFISEKEKPFVTSLTITGAINGDDLIFIKEMAGADVYGQPTEGSLETLDLEEAGIRYGGNPVFIQGNTEFYSDNNVIQAGLFWNCNHIEEVILPKSHIKGLGSHVFFGCTSLQKVSMPDNLTEIPTSTFAFCNSLESVKLPITIETIGDYAFINCFKIKTLGSLPMLKTYGKCSFASCWGLDDFEIPMNQQHIPDSAFYNCINLPIKQLPPDVTSIGAGAFQNCQKISNIDFSTYHKLESIGYEAFMKAALDSVINLPMSMKFIDSRAFMSTDISKVQINSDIRTSPPKFEEYSPDYSPFRSCHKLKEFIVSEGVTFLEVGASVCLHIEVVTLPSTLESIGSESVYSIFTSSSSLQSITFPECLSFIARKSFGSTGINSVSVPSTVKIIQEGCFSHCPIVELTIAEGVEEIHEEAFYNTRIKTLKFPSTLHRIDNLAFSGCENLVSIEIPESVTDLGQSIFENSGLLSATILAPLKSIPSGTFQKCIKLTEVKLPDTIEKIEDAAFMNCSSLSDISLPYGLKSIGKYAFAYCKSLTTIEIPANVTEIESSAFEDSDIKYLILQANTPLDISYDVFNNVNLNEAILVVPDSSIDLYSTHPVWSDFGKIVRFSDYINLIR